MPRKIKTVQGTYIDLETKEILIREALRRDIFISTLASEILTKGAKRIKILEAKCTKIKENVGCA